MTSQETVLVLRTCDQNLKSYRASFQWPESGAVECKDWKPEAICGYGLHGLLWGLGDAELLDWSPEAKWLAVEVEAASEPDAIEAAADLVRREGCTVANVARFGGEE